MHEADEHPGGDEPRLRRDDRLEQGEVGVLGVGGLGVVARDREVGQPAQQCAVLTGRLEHPRVLEGADPQVAARDAHEHRAGLRIEGVVAHERPTRRDHRERTGRGNAERMHGLAHEVLAQHGPDRGEAVAAREGSGARALEVDVAEAGGLGVSLGPA